MIWADIWECFPPPPGSTSMCAGLLRCYTYNLVYMYHIDQWVTIKESKIKSWVYFEQSIVKTPNLAKLGIFIKMVLVLLLSGVARGGQRGARAPGATLGGGR